MRLDSNSGRDQAYQYLRTHVLTDPGVSGTFINEWKNRPMITPVIRGNRPPRAMEKKTTLRREVNQFADAWRVEMTDPQGNVSRVRYGTETLPAAWD